MVIPPGTTIACIRLTRTLFADDKQPCALTDWLHRVLEDNPHVPILQLRLHADGMDDFVQACTGRANPTVNKTQRRHVGMEGTMLLSAAHKPTAKKAGKNKCPFKHPHLDTLRNVVNSKPACTLRERGISGPLKGGEYSREFTQISRFSGENAIFLVPYEGYEGVKLLPQLHAASSNASPAPKAFIMPKRRPKRQVPKTRQGCSRSIGVYSREFLRILHEFCTNFVRISREFHTNFTLVHPLICLNTRGIPPSAPLHAPWPQATMVWGRVVFS